MLAIKVNWMRKKTVILLGLEEDARERSVGKKNKKYKVLEMISSYKQVYNTLYRWSSIHSLHRHHHSLTEAWLISKLKLTSDFLSVSRSIRHLLPCLFLLSGVCREATDSASQKGTFLRRNHWHSHSIVFLWKRWTQTRYGANQGSQSDSPGCLLCPPIAFEYCTPEVMLWSKHRLLRTNA